MLLSSADEKWIDDFIHNTLHFMPSIRKEDFFLPFSINRPFAVYDISNMSEEQIDLLYELAPQALQNCLKPGYMLYAVDWNHNTVLYDPLNTENTFSIRPTIPSFTQTGLGYYFGFYPDGDYIFYLDRYGAFGYLSHPWREEVWIFGISLVEEFQKIYQQLGWRPVALLK